MQASISWVLRDNSLTLNSITCVLGNILLDIVVGLVVVSLFLVSVNKKPFLDTLGRLFALGRLEALQLTDAQYPGLGRHGGRQKSPLDGAVDH